jgi:TolA-binding protein
MAAARAATSRQPPLPGLGVDSGGGPVIDPTQNVLDLVQAAIQRQDDLRAMESRYSHEIANLRAEYDEKLRKAETARIDAIRAVDVGAVNRAAEVANERANTLAMQVQQSAETLRTQVAAAASASTTTLAQALDPLTAAIANLQKTQYELAGQRAQVVENKDERRDSGMGARAWIAIALAAGGVLSSFMLGAAGIVITLVLKG